MPVTMEFSGGISLSVWFDPEALCITGTMRIILFTSAVRISPLDGHASTMFLGAYFKFIYVHSDRLLDVPSTFTFQPAWNEGSYRLDRLSRDHNTECWFDASYYYGYSYSNYYSISGSASTGSESGVVSFTFATAATGATGAEIFLTGGSFDPADLGYQLTDLSGATTGTYPTVDPQAAGTKYEFLDLRSLSSDGFIYLGGVGSSEVTPMVRRQTRVTIRFLILPLVTRLTPRRYLMVSLFRVHRAPLRCHRLSMMVQRNRPMWLSMRVVMASRLI